MWFRGYDGSGEEFMQQTERRTGCACGLEAVWTVQDCQERLVVNCARSYPVDQT